MARWCLEWWAKVHNNRVTLGDDSSGVDTSMFGPLPTMAFDPNLLLLGGGLLLTAFLFRGAGRKVKHYQSRREKRRERKEQLKRELRRL